MDLILIVIIVTVTVGLTWFAWRVGEDKAARLYQSELATQRARARRLQHDLDMAREEITLMRYRDRT
jgi:hypothetical protein